VDTLDHRLERNAFRGVRYSNNHAGVLLRQQTFRDDDVEENCRDERDQRDDQGEALMGQYPAEATLVEIEETSEEIFRPTIKSAAVRLLFLFLGAQ